MEEPTKPDPIVDPVEEPTTSGQNVALEQTKFILWVTVGGTLFLLFYIFVLAFGRS